MTYMGMNYGKKLRERAKRKGNCKNVAKARGFM